METQTITLRGIDFIVQYTVSGKYYPATQYEPAEYPEAEIHSITSNDVEFINFLTSDDQDEIYQLLEL